MLVHSTSQEVMNPVKLTAVKTTRKQDTIRSQSRETSRSKFAVLPVGQVSENMYIDESNTYEWPRTNQTPIKKLDKKDHYRYNILYNNIKQSLDRQQAKSRHTNNYSTTTPQSIKPKLLRNANGSS
jgi:hypothetical protein